METTNPDTRESAAPECAAAALVASVPVVPAPPVPPPPVPAPPASALTEFASETVTPLTHDPVDAWLNHIEDRAIANPEARQWETSGHAASERHVAGGPRLRVRIGYASSNRARVTSTHVPRKWSRRLEVLAFSLVLLLVALMIGPSMWDAGTEAWVYVAQQLGAPTPSPTPSRPMAGVTSPNQSLHN